MIYWETVLSHRSDDLMYTDKGHYFQPDKLQEVRSYGRKRLLLGACKGWYIENTDGSILEKHTYEIQ